MGFFGFPTVERLKGRSALLCVARLKETYCTPRKLTNDNGKSTMNEDVWTLLKMVILQCHVSFQGCI